MFIKKSLAQKKVWARVPKSERSRRMSDLAKLRVKKMTKKQMRDHIRMMVNARDNKNKNK